MYRLVVAMLAAWVCALVAASDDERAGDEPARLSFSYLTTCEQWQQGVTLARVVESVCRREALARRY